MAHTPKGHRHAVHDTGSRPRTGRPLRVWLALAGTFVFLSGLGHVWLHDANVGGYGHFGTPIDQIAPKDKLVVADGPRAAVPVRWVFVAGTARQEHQWPGIPPDLTTAPRAPPSKS